MPPPEIQQGLFAGADWSNRGDAFDDYKPLIGQVYTYLKDTKVSAVPDLYIRDIENFVEYLRRKANDNGWTLVIKKVLKVTYAIVSSLVYIMDHDRSLRASPKFFDALITLGEVMKILEYASQLTDDYRLPPHLEEYI